MRLTQRLQARCLSSHRILCAWLTFSTFPGRVISHGKITANHNKSHQHTGALHNLVLAQIYVYALIQLFSRFNDCTEFDHKDQDRSHYVGYGAQTQCVSSNITDSGNV